MVAKLDPDTGLYVENDEAEAAGLPTNDALPATAKRSKRPIITAGGIAMLVVGALLFWAYANEQRHNNQVSGLSLAPAQVEGNRPTPTVPPAPVASWNCEQLPPVPATEDPTALAQHFVGVVLPQIYAHNAANCLTHHFYGGDGPYSPIGVNGLDKMYNFLREFAGTPSNVQVEDGRKMLEGGWITDLTTVMVIRHADGTSNNYMLEFYRAAENGPWVVKEAQQALNYVPH